MSTHPHAEIVDLWPSPMEFSIRVSRELASDQKAVTNDNARMMRRQGIPTKYWDAVIAAAATCGFEGVTYARLTELAKAPVADALTADQRT